MLLKYRLLKNDSAPWSLLVTNARTPSCVIIYALSRKDKRSQYEAALGSEVIAPCILNICTKLKWFHAPIVFPRSTLDRKLHGQAIRHGRCGDKVFRRHRGIPP
jgi:hypothetical protein